MVVIKAHIYDKDIYSYVRILKNIKGYKDIAHALEEVYIDLGDIANKNLHATYIIGNPGHYIYRELIDGYDDGVKPPYNVGEDSKLAARYLDKLYKLLTEKVEFVKVKSLFGKNEKIKLKKNDLYMDDILRLESKFYAELTVLRDNQKNTNKNLELDDERTM